MNGLVLPPECSLALVVLQPRYGMLVSTLEVLLAASCTEVHRPVAEVALVLVLPQVLADRGETGSRHGRAAFSILLFQVRQLSRL